MALRLERWLSIYGGGLASRWPSALLATDLRVAERYANAVLRSANRWCC